MRNAVFLALLLARLTGNACAGVAPDSARAREAPDMAAESAQGVYFDRDSAALDKTDAALISRLAESLRDDPRLVVTLHSFVDDSGSSAYGLAVSQKRLEAVRAWLLSAGISPRRIRMEILADRTDQGVPCRDDDCRMQWWRVDMVLGY